MKKRLFIIFSIVFVFAMLSFSAFAGTLDSDELKGKLVYSSSDRVSFGKETSYTVESNITLSPGLYYIEFYHEYLYPDILDAVLYFKNIDNDPQGRTYLYYTLDGTYENVYHKNFYVYITTPFSIVFHSTVGSCCFNYSLDIFDTKSISDIKQEAYDEGYNEGKIDGYDEGFTNGYEVGKTDGYDEGYSKGKSDGYTEGNTYGYNIGYEYGYLHGSSEGYSNATGIIESFTSNTPFTPSIPYSDSISVSLDEITIDELTLEEGLYRVYFSWDYSVRDLYGIDLCFNDICNIETYPSDFSYTFQKFEGSTVFYIYVNSPFTISFKGHSAGTLKFDYTLYIRKSDSYDDIYQRGYSIGDFNGYTRGYNVGHGEGYSEGLSYVNESSYNIGYTQGKLDGYNEGFSEGQQSSYDYAYQTGLNDGIPIGKAEGILEGYASGKSDGLSEGYDNGYSTGYNKGETDGYGIGYTAGTSDGYNTGHTVGHNEGFNEGRDIGYEEGKKIATNTAFNEGVQYAIQNSEEVKTTISGIFIGVFDGLVDSFNQLTEGITLMGLTLKQILLTLAALGIIGFALWIIGIKK